MGIEEEIIFMFNQYRKKADKLIVSRKKIEESDLEQNSKDKKIKNIDTKLRKLQDKYIKFLGINPKRKE